MSLYPCDEMCVVYSHVMQVASRISLASVCSSFMCRKSNLGLMLEPDARV